MRKSCMFDALQNGQFQCEPHIRFLRRGGRNQTRNGRSRVNRE